MNGAERPGPDEYHPFYAGYVKEAPAGDVVESLARQGGRLAATLRSVPPGRETHRYAEGKWSVREVVGHLIDSERLFQYRAVHIARGDPAALPEMDPGVWAAASNAGERPLAELVSELEAVRGSTVRLFGGLPAGAWAGRGRASGSEVSVRALAWIIAGHAAHHLEQLRDRYGVVGDGE